MSSPGRPTLQGALENELRIASAGSSDGFIRLDIDVNWPWLLAIESCWPAGGAVGILPPHEMTTLPAGWEGTTAPAVMTRWRNDREARPGSGPALIVGPLRATEETAGLDKVPAFITTEIVLVRWGANLSTWLPQLMPATRTVEYVGRPLAELLSGGALDPHEVDDWVTALQANSEDSLRDELWRCRLLPDRLLLDQQQQNVERRITQNIRVRRLLEGFIAERRDENDLKRLHQAARGGSAVAQQALKYSGERDRRALKELQLEDVLQLLQREKPDPDPDPRPPSNLDILGFLNQAPRLIHTDATAAIDGLGVGLLEAVENAEPGAKEVEASVPLVFLDEDRDLIAKIPIRSGGWVQEASAEQILAIAMPAAESADPDRLVRAESLRNLATAATVAPSTVETYLEARQGLLVFESLLGSEQMFEVLLTVEEVRRVARAFLDAWRALATEALSVPDGPARVALLFFIPSLECRVQDRGSPGLGRESVFLAPFHPYVLEPVLEIAEYARREIGVACLGDRVRWALTRAVPAFSVLWRDSGVFFLCGVAEHGLRFSREPGLTRPPLGAPGRITDVLRAYTGFHPYVDASLAIEFVNPPPGELGGVVATASKQHAHVDARLVLVGEGVTAPGESDLDALAFEGRFDVPQIWANSDPEPVHVRFAFFEANRGRKSALPAAAGPTGGAHLSVHLRMQHADPLVGDAPKLILEYLPRGEDSAVGLLHRVANIGHGSAPYFAYPPALESDLAVHLNTLRNSCEWLVIGAPHPVSRPEVDALGPDWIFLGTETSDAYVYFVFSRSLYAERRRVAEYLRDAPAMLDTDAIEKKLNDVARSTTRGILSIGRGGGAQVWEHLGRVVAQATAMELFAPGGTP